MHCDPSSPPEVCVFDSALEIAQLSDDRRIAAPRPSKKAALQIPLIVSCKKTATRQHGHQRSSLVDAGSYAGSQLIAQNIN